MLVLGLQLPAIGVFSLLLVRLDFVVGATSSLWCLSLESSLTGALTLRDGWYLLHQNARTDALKIFCGCGELKAHFL